MSEKTEADQSAPRQKWSRYRDYLHKLPHTAFDTVRVDEGVCCMACDDPRPTLEQCTKCGLQLCADCSSLIVQSRCRGSLYTLIGIVARWKRGFSSQFLNREEDEVKAGRGMTWAGMHPVYNGRTNNGPGYGLYEGGVYIEGACIEGSLLGEAPYRYRKGTRGEDEDEEYYEAYDEEYERNDEDEEDEEDEENEDEDKDEDEGEDEHMDEGEGGGPYRGEDDDEEEDLYECNIKYPDPRETRRALRRRSITLF